MTDQEITNVVTRVLEQYVRDAGFEGAEVVSDIDFDGDPVIRVTAHYKRRPHVDPDPLLDSVHAIRSALLKQGEDRFVFLKNDVAEERQYDEELD